MQLHFSSLEPEIEEQKNELFACFPALREELKALDLEQTKKNNALLKVQKQQKTLR